MKKLTYREYRNPKEFPYVRDGIDVPMMQAFSIGKGWWPLVHELIGDLFDAGWDGDTLQVKEKFAGLRFYISSSDKVLHDLIDASWGKSVSTCDVCGRLGEIRGGSWLRTRCDEHNTGKPWEEKEEKQ